MDDECPFEWDEGGLHVDRWDGIHTDGPKCRFKRVKGRLQPRGKPETWTVLPGAHVSVHKASDTLRKWKPWTVTKEVTAERTGGQDGSVIIQHQGWYIKFKSSNPGVIECE